MHFTSQGRFFGRRVRHRTWIACKRQAIGTIVGSCLVLGLAATSTAHSQARRPRTAVAPASRFISVWMPYWNMTAAASSALDHAAQIDTASPVWYAVSAAGTVTRDPGADSVSLVEALRARGVAVVPTVTDSAGLNAFDRLLSSSARRAALVGALVQVARQSGYSGLDLDFEQFAVDPRDDAEAAAVAALRIPSWSASCARRCTPIGRTCSVTVMPRTSTAHVLWRGRLATWVYDYHALGDVADTIRIMAYDDHARRGPAGPVAPLAWVEHVISFARTKIPAHKVELGLAAYGWLWGPHGVTAFSDAQAPSIAAAGGAAAGGRRRPPSRASATGRPRPHGRLVRERTRRPPPRPARGSGRVPGSRTVGRRRRDPRVLVTDRRRPARRSERPLDRCARDRPR